MQKPAGLLTYKFDEGEYVLRNVKTECGGLSELNMAKTDLFQVHGRLPVYTDCSC